MSHVPIRRKPLAGLEVVSARSLASLPKFPVTTLTTKFPQPIPSMFHRLKIALITSLLCTGAIAAEEKAPLPWETSSWSVESGLLWEIGTGTPISYRLVPTQFSWRSAAALDHVFSDGSRILIRHRFTLIGSWIQNGPESHYFAVVGSPSLELWDSSSKWCLFTGSGGGAGVLDSRGVKGGQGQDFTLTWFIRGGIEHVIAQNRTVSAGIMYEHMSNGGQTKPNPGIDALGFSLGYSWK